MLIWDMVRFGIICLKLNHGPNISMLIWNINIECTKSDHVPNSIWDIPSWIWDIVSFWMWVFPNRFGKSEIKIPIWECPKSDSEQNRVWSTTEIFLYFEEDENYKTKKKFNHSN